MVALWSRVRGHLHSGWILCSSQQSQVFPPAYSLGGCSSECRSICISPPSSLSCLLPKRTRMKEKEKKKEKEKEKKEKKAVVVVVKTANIDVREKTGLMVQS